MAVDTAQHTLVNFREASQKVTEAARAYFWQHQGDIRLHLSPRCGVGAPYPYEAPSDSDPSLIYYGEVFADGVGWCSCPARVPCKHMRSVGFLLDMSV